MASFKDRLIELLISQKILTKEKLQEALAIHNRKSLPLREVLLKEGFIDEAKLVSVLSESLYIPTLNLANYRVDRSIAEIVPERLARQYCLVPISHIGETLTVAVSDPLNIFAIDDLRLFTGYKIDLVIALEKDIQRTIENIYQHKSSAVAVLDEEEHLQDSPIVSFLSGITLELGGDSEDSNAAPIVKIVNLIIQDALKKRVSDIHIEPHEENLRVRFRIDGDLADVFNIPKKNQNAILARIKIIAGLDTTEIRMPQDGRFKARFSGKEVDFRVSSLPTIFGQKLVLRILDRGSLSLGLAALGFSGSSMPILKEAMARPYGMILVTGPTGSGKSTTLYSILTQLNTPERNIITVEDPVEYQIEGITQVNVRGDIGLSFASGLRAILRQSPDVILIGEIRDAETADIAVKAALTGHLVMSTLHTNNASQAVTRLLDMGLEPFLVASSLIMSSAQRLIRLICERCREPDQPVPQLLKRIGLAGETKFFRGKGCRFCNNTGFYGRSALLEIMMIDDTIREMIVKGSSSEQIEDYAVRNLGMKTLRQDALEKAQNGLTTLEEVLRITAE